MSADLTTPGDSRRVLFAFEWLPRYVLEMFRGLRETLREEGIVVELTYGDPPEEFASRNSSADAEWANHVPNRRVQLGSRGVFWQPIVARTQGAALVVAEQATRALLNYWLLAAQSRNRTRLAFWGHGVNPNQERAVGASEWLKRRLSMYPHWWFAHTESVRSQIRSFGYPDERITVVQNAGDTISLRADLAALAPGSADEIRDELGVGSGPIALFLGSLYEEKRLPFLLAAAEHAHEAVPEFQLVIGGDGPLRAEIEKVAAERAYVAYAGRVDGERKAALLSAAGALSTPGAVGLSIIDGMVAGVPTVTTDVTTHGPEIEYLRNGENGRLLPAQASPAEYGEALVEAMRNGRDLRESAVADGRVYTTEAMIERFGDGIRRALNAPRRRC